MASGSTYPTLSSILEQSQKLTSNNQQQQQSQLNDSSMNFELPSIQLGFDQIEQQSRRIASRNINGKDKDNDSNAYYLLASGGVNANQLSNTINNINLTNTFEPLLPLSDTDVEGYLRHTHEQTIISSIEEGRRLTINSFYNKLDEQMRSNWEKQKEKLFEELGRHQVGSSTSGSNFTSTSNSNGLDGTPRRKGIGGGFDRGSPAITSSSSSSLEAGGSLQMHSKMMKYDRVIRKLNEYRKQGYSFGLINSFGEASISSTSGDSKSTQTTETWKLLSNLVQERDVLNGEFQRTSLSPRQYATAYNSIDQESSSASNLRKMLGEGSKIFLEEQFMNYLEKTLMTRPTEAGLGGIPSLQNKIRGYLNVKYLKNGNWSNPTLEIVNNTPVWARIYYLLRSGHPKEALEFATENEAQIQKLEQSFVPYFKAWLDSPDRRLPKLLRDRFLSEYNQRIRYLTDTSDPYKHALYKLIGRVEINRRNVPGVTETTEDWLWFQLSLVRESINGVIEAPHEKFGLRDLGRSLVKFGEGHFDPKGNRPMLYFQVLLLCGQFERAIAFLHGHSQFQVDAVHFAIALAYYGLLRIPAKSKATDMELLIIEQDGASYDLPKLNFSRLLHRYTRAFVQSDPEEAVHYLYLICLNSDLEGKKGEEQVGICHDLIRELVMETRKYAELLGDVRNDGTKIPGMLERDLVLLHLKDEKSYLLDIVKSAAHRADQEKRFSEAILLYNLAEEYDSVISVLNVELGNSLSKPSSSTNSSSESNSYFKESSESVGMAARGGQEDVAKVARGILEHYDRSSGKGGRVSRKNRETCESLMRLREALTLYEQGRLELALEAIEAINIIPLHSDLVAIIRSSEEFKDLDEAIVRNFDIILLTTMNVIYKLHNALKESPFGDSSRQLKMTELRQKARSLMMFAGMLRFRLTSDTYSALTRLDVFIH